MAHALAARGEVPGGIKFYVIAYHEIIEAPENCAAYDSSRCDVIYDGQISPDFYGCFSSWTISERWNGHG